MKRITLALKSRYNINGQIVQPGVPVAVLETDVPWDGLMSAMFAGQLYEINREDVEADESPVAPQAVQQVESPSVEQSDPVDDQGTVGGDDSQEAAQTTTIEGCQLVDAGLAGSLCKLLNGVGVVTVEQLSQLLADDPALEGKEGINPSTAKRIVAWWDSYQAKQ